MNIYAGQGTGNGGDVVVCEKTDGTTSIELLDLFEARERHLLELDLKPELDTVESHASYQIDKIKDWEGAEYLYQEVSNFNSRIQFVESDLVDIPDSYHTYIPSYCELKQIAINNQDGTITIDQRLWKRLDINNKAALVLHEIFYEMMIFVGQNNSIQTRLLNGYIHGNSSYLFDVDSDQRNRLITEFFYILKPEQDQFNVYKRLYELAPIDFVKKNAFRKICELLTFNQNTSKEIAPFFIELLTSSLTKIYYKEQIFRCLTLYGHDPSSIFRDLEDEFKQILIHYIHNYDLLDSEYVNFTSYSLRFLENMLSNPEPETVDYKYIPVLLNFLELIKSDNRLSLSVKRLYINKTYNVLKKYEPEDHFKLYLKKLFSQYSPQDELDLQEAIQRMSEFVVMYTFKDIISERFLDFLIPHPWGSQAEFNYNILKIYSLKFLDERLFSIIDNALNGDDQFLTEKQVLNLIPNVFPMRGLYAKFATQIENILFEDISSDKFKKMDSFNGLYRMHLEVPERLKSLLIKKIKKRKYKEWNLGLSTLLAILNNKLNMNDETTNLLGFLLQYKYYSISRIDLLSLIGKVVNFPKYLESVIATQMRLYFGDDRETFWNLSVLRDRKVSEEIIDILKQIVRMSNDQTNVNKAKAILKFNGV